MSDTQETFEVLVSRGHCDTWIDPESFEDVYLVGDHTMDRIREWLEDKAIPFTHSMTMMYPSTYEGKTTCGYHRNFVFESEKDSLKFKKVWG